MHRSYLIKEINKKKFKIREIFLAYFYFKSRKLITIMIWIICLNRKTSKMKIGPQLKFNFHRENGGKQKKEKINKKNNLSEKKEITHSTLLILTSLTHHYSFS